MQHTPIIPNRKIVRPPLEPDLRIVILRDEVK